MDNIEEAKAKLATWAASLQNQGARLFKLEEAKRHQARIDMQVYVNQLNAKVHLDVSSRALLMKGLGLKKPWTESIFHCKKLRTAIPLFGL